MPRMICLLLCCALPLAAGPLADYNLNTYNSLILNGSRCTGMGGAVVALGDEADDLFYNAAAAARRNKFQTRWFEWDYSLSFMNILAADNNDYRNASGILPGYRDDGLTYIALAASLLFNRVGISATFNLASSTLTAGSNQYQVVQNNVTVNVSWAAITNRLYVGFGFFTPSFEFKDDDGNKLAKYKYPADSPGSWQIGVIWTPPVIPLSLGANLILNRNGTQNTTTNTLGVDIPREVRHPTTLSLGASWKFDLLPDKRILTEKDKKGKMKTRRLFLLSPEYVLVAASCKIVGTVDNALDIISFSDEMGSTVLPSGERILVEPALGVEVSFPTWLKARAGWYHEAPRITGSRAREHFTANFEGRTFRVFGLDIAVSFTMDWSRNLWSGGFGAKIWRY